jgi:hypothetical protein
LQISLTGKTVTNVEKFRNVRYVDEAGVRLAIKGRGFMKAEHLTDDLYEVVKEKQMVSFALPVTIGFFVYGYAKLRMLRFYYDCVGKYYTRGVMCTLVRVSYVPFNVSYFIYFRQVRRSKGLPVPSHGYRFGVHGLLSSHHG